VLIDQHKCVAELIAYTLHSHGFIVSTRSPEPEWLAGADVDAADVVVLDPVLPSWEHGLALCRAIRARSLIPIVLVTSGCVAETRRVALSSGAADIIAKPFSPTDLAARVAAVLRRTS
jgi:two-component system OmpR family response regulator